MTYEDVLKNMSHKVLQKECNDFVEDVTDHANKTGFLTAEEKVKAESNFLKLVLVLFNILFWNHMIKKVIFLP